MHATEGSDTDPTSDRFAGRRVVNSDTPPLKPTVSVGLVDLVTTVLTRVLTPPMRLATSRTNRKLALVGKSAEGTTSSSRESGAASITPRIGARSAVITELVEVTFQR